MEHPDGRDPLTSLADRATFQRRLVDEAAIASARGSNLGLALFDLDRFRSANDALGHDRGDQILRLVGERITASVRPNDFVARISGDEFVVLLPHLDRVQARASIHAVNVAQRVLDALDAPFEVGSDTVHLSASAGVAIASPNTSDTQEVLRRADLALVSAKQAGRGSLRAFEAPMDEANQRTHCLDRGLRIALEADELELHCQPRMSVATGTVSGAEILLRWPHAPHPVDTSDLIAAAESSGSIQRVGRWVLKEATALARRILDAGVLPEGSTISVNVSGQQLLDPEFVDRLSSDLEQHSLEPGTFTVELTESALVEDIDAAGQRLGALAELGVPMAIDDFGVGYSSLAYLRELPVRELKLDRSFVGSIGRDQVATTIVAGVLDLARRLDIATVAEGVESDEQLDFLREHGCTHYQGFLTAGALSVDEFLERFSPRPDSGAA